MNNSSSASAADSSAHDPQPDRPDDFTGPPITAAEVELLEKLAKVCGELAFEAAGLASVATQEVRAAWATGASAAAATKTLDAETKRFELFSRAARLTIGLKAKRVMELQAWRKRQAAAATTGRAPSEAAARERGRAQQEQATAIVQEIVAKNEGSAAATQARPGIARWFAERDHEPGLPDLPVGEVVARLCRDLGQVVKPQDWQGRPWAKDAENLFGRAAATPEATAAQPARSDAGQAPKSAEAAAPDPEANPQAVATPPEAATPGPEAEPQPDPLEVLRPGLAELRRRHTELRRRGWTPGQNPAHFGNL
jgi:hypothetical protein